MQIMYYEVCSPSKLVQAYEEGTPNEQTSFGNIKCMEESCNFRYRFYIDRLRSHLENVHSILMETEELKFVSFEGI